MSPRTMLRGILFTTIIISMIGCAEEPTGTSQQAPEPPVELATIDVDVSTETLADFSWRAPADSSGITGYRIWWRELPQGIFDSADVDGAARTLRIDGLKTGVQYEISIAAMRGTLISTPAKTQWMATLPQPPSDIVTEFIDPTTARVSWTASADATVTGYLVSWKVDADSGATIVAATERSATIMHLDAAKPYRFYVAARRGSKSSSSTAADWVPNATPPPPPSNVVTTPLSNTSVRVAWTAPSGASGISYKVTWTDGANDNGSVAGLVTTSHDITGLANGRSYTFQVHSVRGGKASGSNTVLSSPTTYFTHDAANPALPLRMYEASSSNNPVLVVDPAKGGPKGLSGTVGTTDVQLGIYVDPSTPYSFVIGPAYAILEFRWADDFDQNVYVSDSTYLATSLGAWFPSASIDQRISKDGNIRAFTLPSTVSDDRGHGFYIRTGVAGNYHYARVFIKNAGGKLLQGTAPNRYVEVEISYQTTPNLPYAKRVGMAPSPAGVVSRRTGR